MTDLTITITIAGISWSMTFTDNLLPLPDSLMKVPPVEALAWKLDGLKIRAMREILASNVLENAQEATQEAQEGPNGADTTPQGRETCLGA